MIEKGGEEGDIEQSVTAQDRTHNTEEGFVPELPESYDITPP